MVNSWQTRGVLRLANAMGVKSGTLVDFSNSAYHDASSMKQRIDTRRKALDDAYETFSAFSYLRLHQYPTNKYSHHTPITNNHPLLAYLVFPPFIYISSHTHTVPLPLFNQSTKLSTPGASVATYTKKQPRPCYEVFCFFVFFRI